ncbi:MAG: hypothetical protein R3F30_10080 [Planctomycetota bacterium]
MLKRTIPITGSGHHYYSHLYLAQALFQRAGRTGTSATTSSPVLLRQQRADGSWMGDGVGTTYAGRPSP